MKDHLAGLHAGMRVVVRYRIPREGITAPSLTDALGDLLAYDGGQVTVQTKRGAVVIDEQDIVAAKEVPSAPARRRPPSVSESLPPES